MKYIGILLLSVSCAFTKNSTKSTSTTGSIVTQSDPQQQKVLYAKECFDDLKKDMMVGDGEYVDTLANLYGFSDPQSLKKFKVLVKDLAPEVVELELDPNETIDLIDSQFN